MVKKVFVKLLNFLIEKLNLLKFISIFRALFGYDGQSNDLKVVSTGKYGLDELQQEFNPGKVLYAFVKVLNPKSNLPCFITISMVSERLIKNLF